MSARESERVKNNDAQVCRLGEIYPLACKLPLREISSRLVHISSARSSARLPASPQPLPALVWPDEGGAARGSRSLSPTLPVSSLLRLLGILSSRNALPMSFGFDCGRNLCILGEIACRLVDWHGHESRRRAFEESVVRQIVTNLLANRAKVFSLLAKSPRLSHPRKTRTWLKRVNLSTSQGSPRDTTT